MKGTFFTIFIILSCCCLQAQQINGVSIVGPFIESENQILDELSDLNANWISLSPEVELDRKSLELEFIASPSHWTMDYKEYLRIINDAKNQNLKIFLKPHVVVSKAINRTDKIKNSVSWRGDIEPKYSWDWRTIQENYRNYLIELATFAEAENIEMLCIGTELKSMVEQNKKFWITLIEDIRLIYSGSLVYSANWDNYMNVPFWKELDFIGVNNYFPISEEAYPFVEQTNKNWDIIKEDLQEYSETYSKKIILTEFGYRNTPFAGREPWIHISNEDHDIANSVQYNLLRSFFESVWNEEWLEGGFLWNWNYYAYPDENTDFSVQNKPAAKLVKRYYSKAY